MNIRPKILKYLLGGFTNYNDWRNTDYYKWFNTLYDETARRLNGSPMTRDLSHWKIGGPTHHQTDDLAARSYSNYTYTLGSNKNNVTSDILNVANLKGQNLTPEQFRDLYNEGIRKMHKFQMESHDYTGINDNNTSEFNTLYNIYYKSKGTDNTQGGILFNEDKKGIYGTQTLQRDVDMYQKSFDDLSDEEKLYRIHKINLNGKDVYYAKQDSGEIQLLPDMNNSPNDPPSEKMSSINANETPDDKKASFFDKLSSGFNKIAPDLLDAIRFAGNMHNNQRVYDESMKAIIPNLLQSYNTHRQVVGDEATKQAYYRRAVQGQTRAARPFTSDADRQMAYLFEAKRVGDELRAQGDLADNQEIRRTSDESNQHLWANIERDTAVANQNYTELIKAAAAKHLLTAQKYSADWTNIDLFLLGLLAKLALKQAEEKQLERQLALLDAQEDLLGDTNLVDLKTAASNAYDKYDTETNPIKKALLKKEYEKAYKDYLLYKIQKTKENLRLYYAKLGTKITKKDNSSKYLYKTSKDIVEHFRKMSKMSDDSRIKTLPKTTKLTSHPKKTKKMLLGGTAPFTIYRPLGTGGETTTTQTSDSSNSKSSKDTAAKDKIDLLKELFKQVEGLPIDVTNVYLKMLATLNKASALGEEMDSDDIAAMYLSSMNELARLKYSKEAYENANKVATANDALGEIAVGANGEMILLDKNGEIKLGSYGEWKNSDGELNPLTNGQLLTMRAHSPNLAFNDRIFDIVSNGIGMSKIASHIKSIAGTIGSMESKIEGISEVQSRKVKNGLQIIAGTADTPDGFYKVTNDVKNSSSNVKAALNYIYGILPENYRTILEIRSNGRGLELIYNMLASQTNDYLKLDIAPLSGKASNGNSENGSEKGSLELNYALKLLNGIGTPRLESFSIGNNNSFQAFGRSSVIANTSAGEPSLGADFSYNEIYKSGVGKILNLDNACFGDVPINKAMKDSIIVDNDKIVGIDLPYIQDKNGRIIPDFKMLERIEEADKEAMRQNLNPENPSDIDKINQIYANKNLPIKYNSANQLSGNYMRFAVIQATANEDAFLSKDGLSSNKTLTLVTDDNEIEKYKRLMTEITKNKKYSLSRTGIFNFRDKDIYKGSIFIPITGDITDATLAGGSSKMTTGMSTNQEILRSAWNTRNYIAPPELNIPK